MTAFTETLVEGVELKAPVHAKCEIILSPEAMQFVAALHRLFNERRKYLLQQRQLRQRRIDHGELPHFTERTRKIRESDWKVAPVPDCLLDRRVEITGPVDRKMIVNALNSGAKVFMADFEDATSPTWKNILEGQRNLYDAVRRQIDFEQDGKRYLLTEEPAVLVVRPRGWHLPEKHLFIDGEPASASLVDFGLFMFHNARYLALTNQGPFFYLPKLESHSEAKLWNDIFIVSQDMLMIPRGTIKATVLIENILAAFEMEEIMYELREHLAGLNAGRWDYIFSLIKKMKAHERFLLPDRSQVTMSVPFMDAYARMLVRVCHKRGAHAIGGMSAFIPSKDEAVNERALQQVRLDKEREAGLGYDGTWVAHPKLVPVAMEVFDRKLGKEPHQKHVFPAGEVKAEDLLAISLPENGITEAGFRYNINIALLYLESWLNGTGAAALYNLMEDAATAEISRAQLWQWLHHKACLDGGRAITPELFQQVMEEEFEKVKAMLPQGRDLRNLENARAILNYLVLNETFEDFLTLNAYEYLE